MKKISVFVCTLLIGVSSLFGVCFYDLEDSAQIDAATWKNAKGETVSYPDNEKKIAKALIGKNSTNTSYDALKDIVKPYENKWNSHLPHVVLFSNKFGSYISNVINDTTYTNYVNAHYLLNQKAFSKFNKSNWRSLFLSEFKKYASVNNITYCIRAINFYNNNIDSFTDAEIKSDMKNCKRIVYPKIGTSDDWKQLAVKIELILKSVE